MADQSFLNGLRTQAGLGTGNYTRTANARSADQNSTNSGNPMTAYNQAPPTQAPSWQQMAMQRQQGLASLAQDPTNIRYVQPQMDAQRRMANQIPLTQQQAYSQGYQPGQYTQPQPNQNPYGAAMAAMPQLNGINTPGLNGIGQQMGAQPGNINPGPNGQPQMMGNYVRPMPPGGGGPVPDQLAQRNVVGSRFVRPMMR